LKDPAKQATLQKKMDDRRLERLLKAVEQIVIDGHNAKVIEDDVMDGISRHLVSIFDHISAYRGMTPSIP